MRIQEETDRKGRNVAPLVRLVAVLFAVAVVGAMVTNTTRAAFNASTSNGSNSLSAGTVVLSDDDANSVMFNLSGMKPGTTATKCINVSYTGSLTADVKLYGTVGGTGLGTYVDTVIDIGSGATGGSTMDCTGFTLASNLHTNTLANFGSTNTNFSTGLGGFTGATNPSSKSYRVKVTLQDNNNAQGKTASATFTWEAQNT